MKVPPLAMNASAEPGARKKLLTRTSEGRSWNVDLNLVFERAHLTLPTTTIVIMPFNELNVAVAVRGLSTFFIWACRQGERV